MVVSRVLKRSIKAQNEEIIIILKIVLSDGVGDDGLFHWHYYFVDNIVIIIIDIIFKCFNYYHNAV